MAAAALIGAVVLLAAAGLAWTARLIHVSNLDALELASKVGVPDPVSALDWPELHVRAIVPQPGDEPLLLLFVGWPEHPQRAATLLLAIDNGDNRSVPLLSLWCATQASVSPTRRDGAGLELRRRQSLERVHAVLIAEDYTVLRLPPAPHPQRRPFPCVPPAPSALFVGELTTFPPALPRFGSAAHRQRCRSPTKKGTPAQSRAAAAASLSPPVQLDSQLPYPPASPCAGRDRGTRPWPRPRPP